MSVTLKMIRSVGALPSVLPMPSFGVRKIWAMAAAGRIAASCRYKPNLVSTMS
jgi:hypothetical protein